MNGKLTPEQESRIEEYHRRYFSQATSCEPADRERAEAAARRMAEIAGVHVCGGVHWVNTPMDGASLRDSLWVSLSSSLSSSLWDSLWDTEWVAYYTYAVEVLGVEIDESTREKLRLHNEIAASCFALWLVPGAVILCERPQSVELRDGKLVGVEWRNK